MKEMETGKSKLFRKKNQVGICCRPSTGAWAMSGRGGD